MITYPVIIRGHYILRNRHVENSKEHFVGVNPARFNGPLKSTNIYENLEEIGETVLRSNGVFVLSKISGLKKIFFTKIIFEENS